METEQRHNPRSSAQFHQETRPGLSDHTGAPSRPGDDQWTTFAHHSQQIEPFQSDPQLLDARLKYILPPIVDAYLEWFIAGSKPAKGGHVDLQTALCSLLYVLCKVRGQRIIVGFLSNEPRYLERVLRALEQTSTTEEGRIVQWQVPYILLLWLSHLLLAPFDLASISDTAAEHEEPLWENYSVTLPPIASTVARTGLYYLPASTKAQEAAATMLVRLVARPDMQRLKVADVLVQVVINDLRPDRNDQNVSVYQQLGPLRFLAGITSTADLNHLAPVIYRTCEQLSGDESVAALMTSAVAKKIVVKVFRNIAILSLRANDASSDALTAFLQSTSVLEEVIDHLLGSLGDRDTPVRYAAAKAISLIVLELDSEMGYQVIQAVLDTFKEDILHHDQRTPDFTTASPLKWHGLTLTLAHTLFKRSAAAEQLPEILTALVAALQFEQRTTTGSSVGTNVRDAANFGIWSLSRRYTTKELLAVDAATLQGTGSSTENQSVIQAMAIQLILSACLDPAGNIRRGSSAALQELIGRHPDQVYEGISLVQIVEYIAVGLRKRAMVNVASQAAASHPMYWAALVDALLGWRGLGSADVISRDAAASSLAGLCAASPTDAENRVVANIIKRLQTCNPSDAETLHGLLLSLAYTVELEQQTRKPGAAASNFKPRPLSSFDQLWKAVERIPHYIKDFSIRIIRSDLPVAVARLIAAICSASLGDEPPSSAIPWDSLEVVTERLLSRSEDSILPHIPRLVVKYMALQCAASAPLGCLDASVLCQKVAAEASKSTLSGDGRAIALGSLASVCGAGLQGGNARKSIQTLGALVSSIGVEWRVIGIKAIQLAMENIASGQTVDSSIMTIIVHAVHTGLHDYTIDERGDIGSLVRLRAISCADSILGHASISNAHAVDLLRADLARLSLEKLDRVRIAAARCSRDNVGQRSITATDIASVSSCAYFRHALRPLQSRSTLPPMCDALLEGIISSAGQSAEPLLQASRIALTETLSECDNTTLSERLTAFTAIIKHMLTESQQNLHPALAMLAYILDMQIPQRLARTDFKWRNLLSVVQKSHHKSNDIPRLTAAVHVYRGLADIPTLRAEVLKKLVTMLKTNPYPRIRVGVAEALWIITAEPSLLGADWAAATAKNKDVVASLEQKLLYMAGPQNS